MDVTPLIGRAPESLSLEERRKLAGNWIALEFYTPATLPLKRIQALGQTVADCIAQLQQRGLNPRRFEYVVLNRGV